MRVKRFLAAAAVLAALGALWLMSGSAIFAYGKADQPQAQIEFSGNCDNPAFPFCAAPPDGVGLGGIWLWIEINADHTADITGSVCDHTFAGTGPHTAGAFAINGDTVWSTTTLADALAAHDQVLPGIDVDHNAIYYAVDVPPSGQFPGETIVFPMSQGHYSAHPVPGVTLQLQVAP